MFKRFKNSDKGSACIKSAVTGIALGALLLGGVNANASEVPQSLLKSLMQANSSTVPGKVVNGQRTGLQAVGNEVKKSNLIDGSYMIELKFRKDNYTFYERYYYINKILFPEPKLFLDMSGKHPKQAKDNGTPAAFNIDAIRVSSAIVLGNKLANVENTVYEFLDMQCPFCKRIHPLVSKFIKDHPEKKFVLVNYPLTNIHPLAYDMALTVKAAYDFDDKFGVALMDSFLSTKSSNFDDMTKVLKSTMKDLYGDKAEAQDKAFRKTIKTKTEEYNSSLSATIKSVGFIPGTPFFVDGTGRVLSAGVGPGNSLVFE